MKEALKKAYDEAYEMAENGAIKLSGVSGDLDTDENKEALDREFEMDEVGGKGKRTMTHRKLLQEIEDRFNGITLVLEELETSGN